jgi:hypothetical protein
VVARGVSGSWMIVCLGCAGPSTDRVPVEDAADTTECDATAAPRLTAYDAIEPDVRFSLVLARDARGVWEPAERLDMPLHHASTITWTDDAQLLESARANRVLVVATGLGRISIEHDERRNTWFVTYGARVERVCARWRG